MILKPQLQILCNSDTCRVTRLGGNYILNAYRAHERDIRDEQRINDYLFVSIRFNHGTDSHRLSVIALVFFIFASSSRPSRWGVSKMTPQKSGSHASLAMSSTCRYKIFRVNYMYQNFLILGSGQWCWIFFSCWRKPRFSGTWYCTPNFFPVLKNQNDPVITPSYTVVYNKKKAPIFSCFVPIKRIVQHTGVNDCRNFVLIIASQKHYSLLPTARGSSRAGKMS